MAVPKYKRGVSGKEYAYSYYKIKKYIMNLLLADFGISETNRSRIPDWLITYKREEILKSLSMISTCISRADSFYPTTEEYKRIKVTLQERAIQELFLLHDIIGECSELFLIEHRGNYIDICSKIKLEVEYLKAWKKATKRIKIIEN